MKFMITSVINEDVFRAYPQLKKYQPFTVRSGYKNMKQYISINSLEELLKMQEEIQCDLILQEDRELLIYDGYIE